MKRKNNKGFTLIELLAVIVILGIILTIVVSNVVKYIGKSRAGAYKDAYSVFVKNMQTQIIASKMDSTVSGLSVCASATACASAYPDVYDSSNMDVVITGSSSPYTVKITGKGTFSNVDLSSGGTYASYCPTNATCTGNVIEFEMDEDGVVQ